MKSDSTVVNGSTFLVTDRDGVASRPHDGLYHRDTQHLDRFRLEADFELEPLEVAEPRPGERVVHVGAPLEGGSRSLHVSRRQVVDDVLAERVSVQNLDSVEQSVRLTLEWGTRFDDLFEVRGHSGGREREIVVRSLEADDVEGIDDSGDSVVGTAFAYNPGDLDASWATTVVTDAGEVADAVDATVESGESRADATVAVDLRLRPNETLTFHVAARPGGTVVGPAEAFEETRRAVHEREAAWEAATEDVDYGPWSDVLAETRENLLELTLDTEYGPVLAAGVPWFATAFGRDSLLAAYQSLPLRTDVAAATCRYLASHQATAHDEFRDAEPGKIMHEIRFGEATIREEVPHAPYYGTIDATALFVVLVHETWRWTGDDAFVEELWPNVEAALDWLDEYGDADGDGFLEYPAERGGAGLTHQAWKDSGDGIVNPDGSHPEGPLAVAEVQGYAYDAKSRAAELAAEVVEDEPAAERLRAEANELRDRFDEAFWVDDERFYAVALDGDNEPVAAVTTNPGHCLWSGIVPDDRADAVVDRLLADDMFTGWGIRTLSSAHEGYNPQSYHRGSVWPHDNSFCVLGMANYGREDAARTVADGLVAAARIRGNDRLPELFAGFEREQTDAPIEYGEACEPQAWAAATPLALLRAVGVTPFR